MATSVTKGKKINESEMESLFTLLEGVRLKHANAGEESGVSKIQWSAAESRKVNYAKDLGEIVSKTKLVHDNSQYLSGYSYTPVTSAVGTLVKAADFNYWGGTAQVSGTTISSGVIDALDKVCIHNGAHNTTYHQVFNGASENTMYYE